MENKEIEIGSFEYPPLHYSAWPGDIEKVKELIEAGADVNAKDLIDGTTSLHWAAYFGHKEIVELLLKSGSKVDAKSNNGNTPLYWAAYSGQEEVIELLITKGAKVNARNKDGETALDVAKSMNIEDGSRNEAITLLSITPALKS